MDANDSLLIFGLQLFISQQQGLMIHLLHVFSASWWRSISPSIMLCSRHSCAGILNLVSLILQAAGGAITSIADSDLYDLAQSGIHIMIAGLSFQVASLALFMGLCLDFAWQVSKKQHELSPDLQMQEVRECALWKAFLGGQ